MGEGGRNGVGSRHWGMETGLGGVDRTKGSWGGIKRY